jgi:glycosyltransferase involved in cell wall biosynthesis
MRWTAAWVLPAIATRLSGTPTAVCHTHFAFENAHPTLYLAALLDCPVSITVHAADIYRDPAAVVKVLNRFDTVVTVCQYNVDLLRRHGLKGPQVAVVPCGVDVPDMAVQDLLDETPGPSRTVLSVGRFVPKKGFDVLVRAWPLVVDRVGPVRLDLVGDGPERERIEKLVGSLGIADSVRFLGARGNSEVLDRIAVADVFALACVVPPDGDSDALPVVIREAMARGRATVTTTVAGIPEALDEASGWLVPPSDPEALARALITALTDASEAARRGRAARERIERTATLEIAALELQEVFAQSFRQPHRGDRR